MFIRLGRVGLLASACALSGPATAADDETQRNRFNQADLDATHEDGFLDARGNATRFAPTYDAWFGEARVREPHVLRALDEAGIWLGLGTAYYWVRVNENR